MSAAAIRRVLFTIAALSLCFALMPQSLLAESASSAPAQPPAAVSSANSGSQLLSAEAPTPEARATALPQIDISAAFQIGDLKGLTGNILFSASIEGRDRIFVLDLDGKRVRRVIEGPGDNSYPSWSPDGHSFAFISNRDGQNQVFVADWDGRNAHRVSPPNLIADAPDWSRTDNRILYSAETGKSGTNSESNLFSVLASGEKPEQITRFSGRQTVPKFAPDGKSVAYSTNRFWPGWDVCISALGDHRETCVLTGAQPFCRQSFSPNGGSLLYSSGPFDDVDLNLLDLTSSKRTSLTTMPGREYDGTWSPDGKLIAFTAEDGRKEVFNLYAIDPVEKKPRPLVLSPYSIRYLSWTSTKTLDLEAERIREEQNQ